MRTIRTVGSVVLLVGLGVVASCAAPSSDEGGGPSIFDVRDPAAPDLAEELTWEQLEARDTTLLYGVDAVQTRVVFLDGLGQAHTRLTQTLDGIPVFGAEAILHLGPDGSFAGFTDGLLHDLKVDTTPVFGASEAIELAVALTGGWGRVTGTPAADLQILRHDGGDHLAWRVQIQQFEAGFDPAVPIVFVDAHRGDLVWQYDNLQHVALSDADKTVWDMENGENYADRPISDSSDPIANETYVHVGWTLAYFQSTHGRDSFNGSGAHVNSYVHYGVDYVNAYWWNDVLTFGDGDGVNSDALTTLDVVAHEFGHGVTEYSSNLIYADESGALNEATSDIFSAAVEASRGGNFQDLWLIGEDCWLDSDGALRHMYDPAIDGDIDYYPHRYTGTADNGGVHWNSGIANLAFHLLSVGGTHPRGKTSTVVTGIGIDNAAAIWYRALTVYMTPSTTFGEARTATIQAAADLNGSWVASVEQAWDAVGVAPPPDYTVIDHQTGLSGAFDSVRHFGPYDTTGCTAIKFETSGTGDADLYTRFGSPPTLSNWNCRPYSASSNETCEFNPSQTGNYYAMVHGYTSYSNLTFRVSTDCGAPPPPPEICDDGTDNDGDGAADCADSDCDAHPACAPPAEVCDDDLDNDEDGDTDCDDADCDEDAACAWTQVNFSNFESTLAPYTDGGADAARLRTSRAHQGNWAVQLSDNSDAASSIYWTNGVDLTGYDELEVSFWFQFRSVETGEDLYVELWNGSSWQTIGRLVRGSPYANNTFYHPVLTVDASQVGFTSSARLRLRADASDDNDDIYVDEILVRAR